jgi:hypothetical protein
MPASKRTSLITSGKTNFVNMKVRDHNEINHISLSGDGNDADGMRLPVSARGLFSGAGTVVQTISYTHLQCDIERHFVGDYLRHH